MSYTQEHPVYTSSLTLVDFGSWLGILGSTSSLSRYCRVRPVTPPILLAACNSPPSFSVLGSMVVAMSGHFAEMAQDYIREAATSPKVHLCV